MSRFVIKVGSSLVTNKRGGVDLENVSRWVRQIAELRQREKKNSGSDMEFLLVTSGAVAEGFRRLQLQEYERTYLPKRRAAAAVGQIELMKMYEFMFSQYSIQVAQILLTKFDLDNASNKRNIKDTIDTLLRLNCVPIINENDVSANLDGALGNNDILGAHIARICLADKYLILTDQDGVFDKNPSSHADAKLVTEMAAASSELDQYAGGAASTASRGGMITKIEAARICGEVGIDTLVGNGRRPGIIANMVDSDFLGTTLKGQTFPSALDRRARDELNVCGTITVNKGAERIALAARRDILPVGVLSFTGKFNAGDLVDVVGENKTLLCKAIVSYGSDDLIVAAGKSSTPENPLSPVVLGKNKISIGTLTSMP